MVCFWDAPKLERKNTRMVLREKGASEHSEDVVNEILGFKNVLSITKRKKPEHIYKKRPFLCDTLTPHRKPSTYVTV